MSTRAKKVALLVASTLFSFLVVEVAFRVLVYLEDSGAGLTALHDQIPIPEDGVAHLGHIVRRSRHPGVIYELKPDLDVTYEGARVVTNSLGMRSPEVEPGPAGFTVVGIGDSIMFGQGVGEGESYLALLGPLAAATPGGAPPGLRVVNLAVPGYNTVMEVAALEAKGLVFDPDLVIVELVGNDLSLPNFVLSRRPVLDLGRSYAVDYFRQRYGWHWDKSEWRQLKLVGMEGIPMEDPEGIGTTIDPSRVPPEHRHLVGWDAYRGAMDRLRELADEHGFAVLVVSLGTHDAPLETEGLAIAAERGFAVLDVGDRLAEELAALGERRWLGSPLTVSATDAHPSARAHRIAAETIAGYLASTDWLR